jgi:hypothetical protein
MRKNRGSKISCHCPFKQIIFRKIVVSWLDLFVMWRHIICNISLPPLIPEICIFCEIFHCHKLRNYDARKVYHRKDIQFFFFIIKNFKYTKLTRPKHKIIKTFTKARLKHNVARFLNKIYTF